MTVVLKRLGAITSHFAKVKYYEFTYELQIDNSNHYNDYLFRYTVNSLIEARLKIEARSEIRKLNRSTSSIREFTVCVTSRVSDQKVY